MMPIGEPNHCSSHPRNPVIKSVASHCEPESPGFTPFLDQCHDWESNPHSAAEQNTHSLSESSQNFVLAYYKNIIRSELTLFLRPFSKFQAM